jgi:hypothetical protein
MNTLTVTTAKYGDIVIREDELPTITEADLRWLGISRDDLLRCFAEGVELMKGTEPGDRVRPIAELHDRPWIDGNRTVARILSGGGRSEGWIVSLCGYSAASDPLLAGHLGTAQ